MANEEIGSKDWSLRLENRWFTYAQIIVSCDQQLTTLKGHWQRMIRVIYMDGYMQDGCSSLSRCYLNRQLRELFYVQLKLFS